MLENVDFTNVGGWTATSILIIGIVTSLIKGWLIPSNLARMWFEAWQTDRHTVETLLKHTESLTKGQETIVSFISSIKEASEKRGSE